MEDEVAGRAANQQLIDAIAMHKRLVRLVHNTKRMLRRDAQAEPARYWPAVQKLDDECKKAAALLQDAPKSHPSVQKLKAVFYSAQHMISSLQERACNWDYFVQKREEAKIELNILRKPLDEMLAKPRRSTVDVRKDFDMISEERKKTNILNDKVCKLQVLSETHPLASACADVQYIQGEAKQMEKWYEEVLNEISAEIDEENLLCDTIDHLNTEMNSICDLLSRELSKKNIENVQFQLPALRAKLAMLNEKYREANRVRKHVDPDCFRFAALEDRMRSFDALLEKAKKAVEKNDHERVIVMITARLLQLKTLSILELMELLENSLYEMENQLQILPKDQADELQAQIEALRNAKKRHFNFRGTILTHVEDASAAFPTAQDNRDNPRDNSSRVEIKVVRNPGDDERLAYVNFERRDCARKVRYSIMDRLKKALGKRVLCDPAGILRDQEGKYIPDRFNRALQQERNGRRSPERRARPKEPPQWRLKEDDADATRTLFVGNMPSDIREYEIRKVFERYGKIEDIDIKTPANTDAAYAFVMFQTLEQAMEAKHREHDRAIRPGTVRCKIGYGKSQVSRRLWVGGLGSWTSADVLAKEFDRYGPIENLEYEDGAEFAYIRFADTNAATDACRAMKNFPLGGRDRCIMVDFAKDDTTKDSNGSVFGRKRRATKSPPGGPRTPPGSPKPVVKSFEELDEEYATTWQGQVLLKKTEYSIRLYRIGGTERLIQKLLRDDDGNAVKLHVTQRLALTGQEGLLERLTNSSSKQLSLMIAVGKQLDDIRPLVRYLTEKDAAGVVTVTGGLLYIFPHSDMSTKLLNHFAPTVRLMSDGCPFLLFVLGLKTTSASNTPEP